MKEIMVKIKGHQVSDAAGEDTMEFVTEAKLYEKGEAMYLIYEETELSGIPGCKTRLKFKGDQVQMKRIGQDGTIGHEIRFEKGKAIANQILPMLNGKHADLDDLDSSTQGLIQLLLGASHG